MTNSNSGPGDNLPDPVSEVSSRVFGIPFPFPWQRLIMAAVLDAAAPGDGGAEAPEPLRRIAVLPTGAGKSLCWMLPAVMIEGLTVAVFPLLSLMADQERRLREAGVPSVTLRGGLSAEERRRIWKELEGGAVKIVLANPEVLQNPKVGDRLGALGPKFLVVDETHTVSQWGETFRPACAGLGRLTAQWHPAAVLALTATAGPQLRERITELLFNGERPSEALADPDRPAIRYGVLPALSRFHLLERLVRDEPRPAIVFGSTRSSVQSAARLLRYRLRDDRIRFYHAGLSPDEKRRLEDWFFLSVDGVLCATCAYGMGVDKANIRTVIHLAPPSSAEAYLQESGRGSRDGKGANAWLIRTPRPDGNPNGPPGGTEPASAEQASAQRQAGMNRYAESTDRCRRVMLLEALSIEAQDCSGCDVCGGKAWMAPPEQETVLKVLRWNRGRFNRGQLARVLIGRRSADVRKSGLDSARGFGALAGWDLDDAEEAVSTLMRLGRLRYGRLGRRRLVPGR